MPINEDLKSNDIIVNGVPLSIWIALSSAEKDRIRKEYKQKLSTKQEKTLRPKKAK